MDIKSKYDKINEKFYKLFNEEILKIKLFFKYKTEWMPTKDMLRVFFKVRIYMTGCTHILGFHFNRKRYFQFYKNWATIYYY